MTNQFNLSAWVEQNAIPHDLGYTANLIGISEQDLKNYLSGSHEIPRYVYQSCRAVTLSKQLTQSSVSKLPNPKQDGRLTRHLFVAILNDLPIESSLAVPDATYRLKTK